MEVNNNDADDPFNINRDELSTPSLHKLGQKTDLKKVIIISSIALLVLIILIIIIVLATKKSDESSNKSNDNEPSDDIIEGDEIGKIECIFDTAKQTRILSDEFNSQKMIIYIDGEKVKYTKEYYFQEFGIHRINFLIFEDFNMDYPKLKIMSLP